MRVAVTVEFVVDVPSDCNLASTITNVENASFQAIHNGKYQEVADGYESYATTGVMLATEEAELQ